MSMREKVAICIPHWGGISVKFAHTMYSQALTKEEDFDKVLLTCAGILNLDTERNVLVQKALSDPNVTHILFIDSDCILEEYSLNDAIRIMMDTNLSIVSGLYRVKQLHNGKYPYAMWKKNNDGYETVDTWEGGNLIHCDTVGFGFIMIQREVFEKISSPWFIWDNANKGEDWSACEKFIAAGYRVDVLTDIKLSHIGTFELTCNGSIIPISI